VPREYLRQPPQRQQAADFPFFLLDVRRVGKERRDVQGNSQVIAYVPQAIKAIANWISKNV
jgi:hypothetical protein